MFIVCKTCTHRQGVKFRAALKIRAAVEWYEEYAGR